MLFVDILLWPGTVVCRQLDIDPEKDQGLVRSMFNMIIYLTVILTILWIFS